MGYSNFKKLLYLIVNVDEMLVLFFFFFCSAHSCLSRLFAVSLPRGFGLFIHTVLSAADKNCHFPFQILNSLTLTQHTHFLAGICTVRDNQSPPVASDPFLHKTPQIHE